MRHITKHVYQMLLVPGWRGCAIGRTLDLRFTGCGFKSWPGTIMYWPWASYLHLCASVIKQYNLLPAKDRLRSVVGKVTVGLTSHWPKVAIQHRLSGI